MTETPAYPGYATPVFVERDNFWLVKAMPWEKNLGAVWDNSKRGGWTAYDTRGAYVGLFPDKQAAGEALIRHAGYEVLG